MLRTQAAARAIAATTAPDRLSSRPVGALGVRAWVALAALCFIYVLNFLDRQLLSILAKPIQDSLHLTDGQLGRIGGLYFALFYCLISIPVGWLADKTNRVRVVSLACAIWSLATMGCGLSINYPQLVASRMAVGVGEAGGVPPSYAIISDYFPPGRRGTALSLYNLGPPIGQALGVAFGASIAASYNWRDAFLVIGAIGVVAATTVLFVVAEPRRGGLDRPAAAPPPTSQADAQTGFWRTLTMFVCTPSLLLFALASGATQIVTYGAGNFTTLFLMREKGMGLHQLAIYYALLVGLCMSAGIFVSGRVIDRFTRRSRVAYALVPAGALVLAAPFFIGFVQAPTWPLALIFLIGPSLLNYFYLSSAVAFVQERVAPHRRVLSGALLLLIMNLIGLGLGPTYVGAASDYFRASHPDHSLQFAFYALLPFYGLAIALFLGLAAVLRNETLKIGALRS